MNAQEFATLQAIHEALEKALVGVEALLAAGVAEPPIFPPDEPPERPAAGLPDEAAWKRFFDYVRERPPLGPRLNQLEVDGCRRILAACADERLPASWAAYVLATAYHETDGQLRPIAEIGKGKGRSYGVPGPHNGQVAYGRGDVQLTWPDNYARADAALGLGGALIADYDLALDPEISARILVRGMRDGWFTGKTLNDRIGGPPAPKEHFVRARAIVNGTDKAELIAGYAVTFQDALLAAGWQ